MMYRKCEKCGHEWWTPERCPECEISRLVARLKEAEGLVGDLMYWQPSPLRVRECRWCGALGPVNETHRKLPPAPHEPGCRFAAFLASGAQDGKEKAK